MAAAAAAPFAPVEVAAAGLGEFFGLKKSANVFFAGEADGLAIAAGEGDIFALRLRLAAGEGDASSVAAAGEALVVASVFLCDLCLAGDADASGEGD